MRDKYNILTAVQRLLVTGQTSIHRTTNRYNAVNCMFLVELMKLLTTPRIWDSELFCVELMIV